MRRFIILILVLIVSVWLGMKLIDDPGMALFTYKTWSVQMPLWFAGLSLLLLMYVLYLVLAFFGGIDSLYLRFKNWLKWRKKNKAFNLTNQGLVELIEGNWNKAESYLLEGVKRSETPLINYLAAAKAAHESKSYSNRDLYLAKAFASAPEAEMAIGITRARFQYQQGQLDQALTTLTALQTKSPRHPEVLKLLERIYIHTGDWNALLNLLPDMRKAQVFTSEQFDLLEKRIYQEKLESPNSQNLDLQEWRQLFDNLPRRFKKDPTLQKIYALKLLQYPDTISEAEDIIKKIMKNSWDEELVLAYGVTNSIDPKKRLAQVEQWQKQNPTQPALLLTLGRLSLQSQLWGKARNYFAESLQQNKSPEVYFEYGKLLEQLGDTSGAIIQYREGLLSQKTADK